MDFGLNHSYMEIVYIYVCVGLRKTKQSLYVIKIFFNGD